MISNLILDGLTLNQLISEKCRCSPYFYSFDYSRQQFAAGSPKWGPGWTAYNILSCFFNLFLWPLTILHGIVWSLVFHPGVASPTISYLLISVLFTSIICNGYNVTLSSESGNVVLHGNQLLAFCSRIDPIFEGMRMTSGRISITVILKDLWNETFRILTTRKGDFTGVLVQLFILICSVSPIPFVLCTTLLLNVNFFSWRADQVTVSSNLIYKLLSLIVEEHMFLNLLAESIITIMATVVGLEMARVSRFVTFQGMFATELTSELLLRIYAKGKLPNCQTEALEEYKILYQIHTKLLKGSAQLLHNAYQAGSAILVLSLSGVLIGWKFLSLPGYYFCWASAAVMTSGACAFFPGAIRSMNVSGKILHEWKENVGGFTKGSRAYNKRVLAGLRPVGFPIEAKGMVDTELVIDFVVRIVLNTQDLILFLKDVM